MGRYYDGNISGKFWFAVQNSTDGEFFGMQEQDPSLIHYYSDDLEKAEEGLEKCKEALGRNLNKLNDFFGHAKSYTDEKVADYLNMGLADAHKILIWYARHELGKKIVKAIKEDGECYYDAEF